MPLTQKSRVAELRELAGFTQAQLAVLVGVTPNTIQNWEKPNGLKQLERYLKMAELFGCQVEELVEYVQAEESDSSVIKKTKEFSLEDIQALRKRWGTAARTSTQSPKE
ncbi:MAG: helix-turn-helix domain-containing protein [Leptolyngbya sp. SIO1D8]|nr:helix-turn-helix domain-containing protein [Leptolyngbya sp. SIO1D8]